MGWLGHQPVTNLGAEADRFLSAHVVVKDWKIWGDMRRHDQSSLALDLPANGVWEQMR